MGGTFDYFGERIHPDYKNITSEQFNNRMILRQAMTNHGFDPLPEMAAFYLKRQDLSGHLFHFPCE
ncbi:MAG: hypothetical protein IJF99_08950 [Methanobrevibacter sp.]|nr:hypothetical protein [Methanobrevibacter sp.]